MVLSFSKWALLFLMPLLAFAAPQPFLKTHPFYVSVVEVNHNSQAAALEISCKLFAEDMEAVLEQQYKTPVDFGQAQQKEKTDELLIDYIKKHLSLIADNKTLQLHYIGFEQENESLYCHFEIPGVPAVKALELNNQLLYDFTDKQINIMHVMVNGVRKSHKLDYPATQASFRF